MTAFIQICLWLFVLNEIADRIAPLQETWKRRSRLKKLVKMNKRLSDKADSDYKAGFFYGKAKQYENELKEMRYFDYE